MNALQIAAILYLLIAFGVNQPTVDTVHSILLQSIATTTQPIDFGGTVSPVQPEFQSVQVQQQEAPAPKFVQNPTVLITHGENVNEYTVLWQSDIPAGATFNLCIATRDPSQCTFQQQFPQNTSFSFQTERPASSAEFYSIGLMANGQTTWYYNQFPQ